ncbi:MAG: Xaa-Pro peptidase family protein [Armatimonadota bacterium]|nr:Xaa-Pro peptidase family protein [Armatimonadota bacterium]MDR7534310.1 Xaa-Pro peptidase family protein [Armatimonadota bacterium]MDR7535922.1 Xaa-Pro peptidase family protein [Armatimonadota bacterium]
MPNGPVPERVRRLREGMRARGLDALVCLKPQNTFYVSDFNPVIYSHPVVTVLPAEGEPVLLVHALRDDHARASSWIGHVRLFGAWSTKQTMGPDWLAALRAILVELGAASGRLGVEFDFLPVGVMRQMEGLLPQARLEDASDVVNHARLVKDPVELERMRRAAFLADRGMEAAIAAAAERRSEREISLAAMAAMNGVWAERFPQTEVADFGSLEGGVMNGLWCYCLIGDRIPMNCDVPTTRRPAEGEFGLIVIWTVCDGMHAENERTVAFGPPDPERRRMYDAILRVRTEVASAIRPGATCADVYRAARAVYESQGYGQYLPGRIGHGLGLGPHEHPSLGPADATRLEPGMVLTFEPNLRIPGLGGMQHSDTILVTDGGFEFVTDLRRDYIQV